MNIDTGEAHPEEGSRFTCTRCGRRFIYVAPVPKFLSERRDVPKRSIPLWILLSLLVGAALIFFWVKHAWDARHKTNRLTSSQLADVEQQSSRAVVDYVTDVLERGVNDDVAFERMAHAINNVKWNENHEDRREFLAVLRVLSQMAVENNRKCEEFAGQWGPLASDLFDESSPDYIVNNGPRLQTIVAKLGRLSRDFDDYVCGMETNFEQRIECVSHVKEANILIVKKSFLKALRGPKALSGIFMDQVVVLNQILALLTDIQCARVDPEKSRIEIANLCKRYDSNIGKISRMVAHAEKMMGETKDE